MQSQGGAALAELANFGPFRGLNRAFFEAASQACRLTIITARNATKILRCFNQCETNRSGNVPRTFAGCRNGAMAKWKTSSALAPVVFLKAPAFPSPIIEARANRGRPRKERPQDRAPRPKQHPQKQNRTPP